MRRVPCRFDRGCVWCIGCQNYIYVRVYVYMYGRVTCGVPLQAFWQGLRLVYRVSELYMYVCMYICMVADHAACLFRCFDRGCVWYVGLQIHSHTLQKHSLPLYIYTHAQYTYIHTQHPINARLSTLQKHSAALYIYMHAQYTYFTYTTPYQRPTQHPTHTCPHLTQTFPGPMNIHACTIYICIHTTPYQRSIQHPTPAFPHPTYTFPHPIHTHAYTI